MPPLMKPIDLKWLDIVDLDKTGASQTNYSDIISIFQLAKTSVLTSAQITELTNSFSDPFAIAAIDLNPSDLPELVEHNPSMVSELLTHILNESLNGNVVDEMNKFGGLKHCSDDKIPLILEALLNLDMSLHSMEVVNQLSTHCSPGILPVSFIRTYISNCITRCENVKDKYLQVTISNSSSVILLFNMLIYIVLCCDIVESYGEVVMRVFTIFNSTPHTGKW